MSRVVALEQGLEHIGEYLKSKGYTVVPWGRSPVAVDAVVYTGRKLDDIYSNAFIQTEDYISGSIREDAHFGVLLVNAQNKTPEQVYEILKNRVYENII